MSLNGRLTAAELSPIAGGQLARQYALRWNLMQARVRAAGRPTIMPNGSLSSYRSFAGQVLMRRQWCAQGKCQNAAVPGTSNHGWGRAVDNGRKQEAIRYGHGVGVRDPSDAPWECVSMGTRILTRRGFVAFDDIRPDDETVGYNLETGESEWTPILAARQTRGDLLRYSTSTIAMEATENHRWLTRSRYAPDAVATLATMGRVGAQDPIVLATSMGAQDRRLSITSHEAALIGWAMTDGTIYRFGSRASFRVYQSKPVGVAAVEALMEHFPHTRDDDFVKGPAHHAKVVRWYIGREVASEVLHRSRFDELGVVQWVLALDGPQRRAFFDAVQMAEGEQAIDMKRIAQSEPDNREAIALAAALEGHLVALRPKTVNLKRPVVRKNSLDVEALGKQDVWCPTTGLGSWTAEYDGHVFLTGNSWHTLVHLDPIAVSASQPLHGTISRGTKNKRATVHLKRTLHKIPSAHKKGQGRWRNVWGYSGHFGPGLERAVKRFQRDHKLKADGVVGKSTWRALHAAAKR